ncbi:hypothetical protein VB715_19930 [Crocosphaera sp. UHCC 0190]|uniref:hypothetical protein n=1 Tax=Crocosphaera sp. UHCC 0190 TaxID=3110246 RepID=UPI002B1EB4B9|nr:hypothetical protein [Crocosphaera sp. UHCC 0190]MEA5512046.1 hypothetical protein [Crocosphaera sp. UHCC 0190]
MSDPVTVTYSLEEVLKRMDDKLDKMNERFDKIDERLNKIEIEVTEVKTELKGMNKRLDSQEFINRSVAIGVIIALTSGVIKLFFPNFLNLPH